MSPVPDKFKGFVTDGSENWKSLKLSEFDHKPLTPRDVVIKVECCGVCGSDIHTASSNWGPVLRKDLVVGHEIVGKAVHVGKDVKSIKVGDRVGLGAGSGSCEECPRCLGGDENYCPKPIFTYNGKSYKADDYVTQGGYADYAIGEEQFIFPIPENLPSEYAGPLLCGGLTVYSPLVRALGKDFTGKTIGVIGIGGLGHLAVKFASALGAEVVAFSRTTAKKADVLAMGASAIIGTQEDSEWAGKNWNKFDLILNTTSIFTENAVIPYLTTLKVGGTFANVSAPPAEQTINVSPFMLIGTGTKISGSAIGSKTEALEMLKLCADKKIYPIIEKVPINEKNCQEVMARAEKSDVKYRFVFTDYDKAFA